MIELKKNKYLVTAIVSTYNSEEFFEEKIKDLINQTVFDDLEIVIVNSGSEQNESEIIKPYLEKFSNIKYIETENRETIYAAWNRAIKESAGEYITNANTDDRLKEDAFEVLSHALNENPTAGLVYAGQYYSFIKNETFSEASKNKSIKNPNFDKILHIDRALIGSQPMWRSKIHFDDGVWFEESYEVSGDHDFELKIALNYEILKLEDMLGTFFRSKTINKSYENIERTRNEVRRIKGIYAEIYLREIDNYFLYPYLRKINFYSSIPISLYLLINRTYRLFNSVPTMFSLEFVYLFSALFYEKKGAFAKAKKKCMKYLKKKESSNISRVCVRLEKYVL